tara:strand:- start:264 stop:2183 length:1920 start_codon:yes stop_codon:yes gene_type:complete
MSSAINNKRSLPGSGVSVDKRQIRQKQLLIPIGKYGKVGGPLKDITPERYKDMHEVQTAVRGGTSYLQCPDGHDLVFRNGSKDGSRRAHFAHKHDCHNDGCKYIKKYGGKGESPEHLQAKLWFGRQPRVVFRVECEQVCGNVVRTYKVPEKYTYVTEHRLTMTNGKYISVDGAFIDESGAVQLVVEVYKTHGTTDDKLDWLQKQAFQFFEVRAQDVKNSCNGVVSIINQDNDHRLCGECEKRLQEALDAQKKHDDAQKKHDDHVREAKKREAITLKLNRMRQKKTQQKRQENIRRMQENARRIQENARRIQENARRIQEEEAKREEAERKAKEKRFAEVHQWIRWGYDGNLLSASCNIKNSFDCVMKSVAHNGLELQWASEALKGNERVAMAAVVQNGLALEHASDDLKGDKRVAMAAVARNGNALQYASEELRRDKEVVMIAVAQSGRALQYTSEELRGDKEVAMAAVAQNGRALQWASNELKGDKEVVMAAVAQDGFALRYASYELKGDKEVVMVAMSNNLIALKYIAKTLCNDKDLAKNALKMNIHTIQFFSVQIALDYIKTNVGRKHVFIKNMPDSLRNNKNIVSIFVKHNGTSLEHASDDLRDDVDIVKLAIDNWPHSVYFASERVKNILENAP